MQSVSNAINIIYATYTELKYTFPYHVCFKLQVKI